MKEVGLVFDVGRKWLYQRIQVIINECRNAFSGGTIVKDDYATRVSLFVNFREDTEKASSRIWVESAHVLRTCAAANDIPI